MAGDLNVGNVIGYLRLNASQWSAEIASAKGQARELGRENPKISISTNAPKALAELESVAIAAKRLQDATAKVAIAQSKLNDVTAAGGTGTKLLTAQQALAKASRDVELGQIRLAKAYQVTDLEQSKVARSAKQVTDSFHPLIAAAALIAPAIVPLGAVAAASLGAAALSAGALAAAVAGAKTAMDSGTVTGRAYSDGLSELKDLLGEVEATAATAALPSFNQAVADAQGLFPALNSEVGTFAAITGDIADHVLHGLIGGFITLEPLFERIALDADKGARAFDQYANGAGLGKFSVWTQSNLPRIEHDVDSVAVAAGKLTAALGPAGLAGLSTLGLLARAIDALPVDVLRVAVPLIVDLYAAVQAGKGIDKAVDALATLTNNVRNFATQAEVAAPAALALGDAERVAGAGFTAALGPVGAIVTGIGLLAATFLSSSSSTDAATSAMQSYTSAVKDDNGTIADHVKTQLADNLVKSNAITNASKLGIATDSITDAVLKGGAPLATLKTQLEGVITSGTHYVTSGKVVTGGMDDQAKAAQALLDILSAQSGGLSSSVNQYQQLQGVLGALGVTTGATGLSATQMGDAYTWAGRTANTSIQPVLDAMQTFAKSTGTAADKAALLGAVLKGSQGDALNYGASISGAYDAVRNLESSFDASQRSAINAKTGLIDYKNAGAVPLIGELQKLQDAALAAAQGTYQHEVSTLGDNKALQDAQDIFESMTNGTLVDNAAKLGLTKDEAKKLADQYFAVPKDLTTTVQSIGLNNINDTLGKIGEQLAILTGTPWNVDITLNRTATGIPLSGADSAATAAAQLTDLARRNASGTGNGYAAGGSLVDGVGTVGELGPEWYVKTGSNVQIIPMSSGVRAPSASSPAGRSASASYTTGAPAPVVQTVYRDITFAVDGKAITSAVNEGNLRNARRG